MQSGELQALLNCLPLLDAVHELEDLLMSKPGESKPYNSGALNL
jgi:hypothetical protein